MGHLPEGRREVKSSEDFQGENSWESELEGELLKTRLLKGQEINELPKKRMKGKRSGGFHCTRNKFSNMTKGQKLRNGGGPETRHKGEPETAAVKQLIYTLKSSGQEGTTRRIQTRSEARKSGQSKPEAQEGSS